MPTLPAMKHLGEFARYCLAGGLAFLADFATFLLLSELRGVNYLVANTLGFLAGLIVNYLISISWVFAHRKYATATPEFSFFAIIGVGGIALGNSGMWLLIELLEFGHIQAKCLVTAVVLLYNYSMRKYFLFRAPTIVRE
jgi:putative flippase GtrA